MKFTVDRSKWYRGKGESQSALLRSDDQRCCIGFVGQQCGVPDIHMLNYSSILDIEVLNSIRLFPAWMQEKEPVNIEELRRIYPDMPEHQSRIRLAYCVNDDLSLSDEQREEKLKQIFAAAGDEIEFIN